MTTYGQNISKERLGVAGPIVFNKISYNLTWTDNLAWTDKPEKNYYKQEYVPLGQRPKRFKNIILLEAITGKVQLNDIVLPKIAELKRLNQVNPLVNPVVYKKKNEVVIDFTMFKNSFDGKSLSIVERNVYRFKATKDKNGQNCVILFGVSERAYDENCSAYLAKKKKNKMALITQVQNFKIPQFTISD